MIKLRSLPKNLQMRLEQASRRKADNARISRKAGEITTHVPAPSGVRPVIFFKASTGPSDFTYNEAFNILAAWGLRLQGVPVIHFVCDRGMQPCVMGTNRLRPQASPPCRTCTAHSRALFAGANSSWFNYQPEPSLEAALSNLSTSDLMAFEYDHGVEGIDSPIPLGALVTPGLRWILRRQNLIDNLDTRYLFRQYILSAWNIASHFTTLISRVDPQAVVVFNGQFYPEAVARWICIKRGIRSYTHEVGFLPFSGFFTAGEATASPIPIPTEFEMNPAQDARLDAYLEKRFQGQFKMAGIRFWPEMKGLDEAFLERAAQFKQIVPVFTNVIFDTSQPHANTIFRDMFAWLGLVTDLAVSHTDTLFIIRSHPDETRPGKESLETVQAWVANHDVAGMPNVLFVAPTEYSSSYELIQRSKFVMVYNSTIGLEASIMGAAVLCAGKARFTQYRTVFFPQSEAEYRTMAEQFLAAEQIDVPAEFRRNARRLLYFQLFRTSLPFDPFLTTNVLPSLTRFKDFSWEQLLPENSPAIAALLRGILNGDDFLLEEKQ
jgi:hypothetical protein